MRARQLLLVPFVSAAVAVLPTIAGAQRIVIRSCPSPTAVGARRYADCVYERERDRAEQRELLRDRLSLQRERNNWDAIVRQARAEARRRDLADRAREQAVERAARAREQAIERSIRARELSEARAERAREHAEAMRRARTYRVRW